MRLDRLFFYYFLFYWLRRWLFLNLDFRLCRLFNYWLSFCRLSNAERMLYLGIQRVSFYSATMIVKTLNMTGVWDDYEFTDYPSTFDPSGNPVLWIPTVYMDYRSTPADHYLWLKRADQVIQARLDRKGLFHTVSHARRDHVVGESQWLRFMMTNRKGDITSHKVEEFKLARPPAVLVSPSVGTGYDFIHDQCRYQIIGKVPWPDGRTKLMKARTQIDPQHGAYIAAQSLVQMCGRGRRADDDWCENFIIDDHIVKFMQRNGGTLTPKWFRDCYRDDVMTIPEPRRLR